MGLLARQTINCERISVGVGRRRRRGRMRGMQEGPRNITALIFHPGSRARRFAPVFNITPRSRMFYSPPPPSPRPSTITSPSPLFYPVLHSPALGALRTKARGIAPRNEFTILIWRAALAIYYLHGVGEKKRGWGVGGGGRRTNDSGRLWKLGGGWGPGSPRGRRDNSRGSKIYRIYMRAPR